MKNEHILSHKVELGTSQVYMMSGNHNGPQPMGNARKHWVEAPHTMHIKKPKHFQQQLPKIEREKVSTVRRSQKLTDKITALQKLVSPYGKTDTASVLLEASITIKALQDQIENLFQTLSGKPRLKMRGEFVDLESRGLCLVPVSFSEKSTCDYPLHTLYQEQYIQ